MSAKPRPRFTLVCTEETRNEEPLVFVRHYLTKDDAWNDFIRMSELIEDAVCDGFEFRKTHMQPFFSENPVNIDRFWFLLTCIPDEPSEDADEEILSEFWFTRRRISENEQKVRQVVGNLLPNLLQKQVNSKEREKTDENR